MPQEHNQRDQQLYQITAKVLPEIWQARLSVIKNDYEINYEQYDQDIISKIENLLSNWENVYGNQAEILRYIIISPLSSGVITKSYEFQIALFDEKLYLNENPMCVYWTPKFIFNDVEIDMLLYKQMVPKEIIRLRENEVNEIRRRYVLCHDYIAMFYMDKIMKKVRQLPIWRKVAANDVKVLYGTYMEKMVEIGKTEEDGKA